jgi:hypothetical protein
MSFDERYQLLELSGDEGVKTFIAREVSTGKKVTAFLFVAEQAHLQAELLGRLRVADRLQLPELIEIGDNQGTVYVITQPGVSFAALKDRASPLKSSTPAHAEQHAGEFSRAGIWRVPSAPQSTSSHMEKPLEKSALFEQKPLKAETQAAPGSFTQIFQTSAPPIGESSPEPPKIPAPPTAAAPPEKSAPGSFTQTFQAAAPPIGEAAQEPPKIPAPPPAAAPPEKSAPGSFTQMFQAAAPPIGEAAPELPKIQTPPAAAAPPEKSAPGSFTQMFQTAAPALGESIPSAPKASAPPSAPGSFTQMFQAAAPPIGEPKPAGQQTTPVQAAPGEFTRFFSSPSPTPTAPSLPTKPEAQGEFDRLFGSGDRVTAPPSSVTGIFNQPLAAPTTKPELTGSAASPAPQPAFAQPAGEFTRIFGETSIKIPALGTVPVPQAPSSQPPAGVPGEYTRMFGAVSMPVEPIAATPQAPAPTETPEFPAPAKHRSILIPVLIGAIVLLLAAIAIIVISMRK